MTRPWRGAGRYLARALSLAVTVVLLTALYRTLDITLIAEALLRADNAWLFISIAAILPITLLRAVRFYLVAPAGALPGIGEAFRLTIVSSALNIVIPAKAGDLIKSYAVARRSETSPAVAVAIVVYERLCDLSAVIFWCVVGWSIARPEVMGIPGLLWLPLAIIGAVCGVLILSSRAASLFPSLIAALPLSERIPKLREIVQGWPGLLQLLRGRRRLVIPFSLLLWLTHLFQMWLFTIALAVPVPFLVCASLSAVALMAGLLPITIAGLGTRDVALVVLLAGYMAPESAAAMGILIATRNVIPALLGMPIMWPYLSSVVAEARIWRAAEQAD